MLTGELKLVLALILLSLNRIDSVTSLEPRILSGAYPKDCGALLRVSVFVFLIKE